MDCIDRKASPNEDDGDDENEGGGGGGGGGSRRGGGFVGFVVDCGCWVDGWMLVNLWVSHLLSFLIGLVSK